MKTMLEVAQEYGLQIQKEGTVLRAFCPFHDDTKKPNFTVYEDDKGGSWFCFACSIGGDIASFVAKIENISYAEAAQRLRGGDSMEDTIATLDGLDYSTKVTFNEVANIQVSQLCRDILYRRPDLTEKVTEFLKRFDQELAQPLDFKKMEKFVVEARTLERS